MQEGAPNDGLGKMAFEIAVEGDELVLNGLTVFMFPIKSPGIEVQRIEMLNGSREFCQEFLTDVRVPDRDVPFRDVPRSRSAG
jgi:alkylation response protein AidB-like acyl-CoA dehydrogenase